MWSFIVLKSVKSPFVSHDIETNKLWSRVPYGKPTVDQEGTVFSGFYGAEDSLLHSQEPVSGPSPVPDQCTPHHVRLRFASLRSINACLWIFICFCFGPV
jgi:hypothetical protein